MLKNGICRAMLSGTALAPLLCAAPAVQAQAQPVAAAGAAPSAAPDTPIQDIVVTANKREEKLNRVGSTVAALSGQTLTERKITTLSNIAAVVPGLSFAESSSNTPILTLRGVGFNSAALGSFPAVSAYTDQIPLPFPVLVLHATYDLERIEVLKGPQGTLFGENATGGAINFIAAKPTSTLQAGGDVSYGRFNDVQGNVYLSGPISETLRARVAGTFENSDGWQISNSRPYDRNGTLSYGAGRLILDWRPAERVRFSLNINGWVDRSQPQAAQFIALNPQSPTRVQPAELAVPFSPQTPTAADWPAGQYAPRGNRKFYQLGLRSDFDLTDKITLTSLTSYDHFTQTQTQGFGGVPILITDSHENGYIRSFNEEVRLANAATMPLRWVIGANYEHSTTYDYQLVDISGNSVANDPNAGNIDLSFSDVHQKIRNIAGFGNIEYDPTAKLTIKAGVRYTDSRNVADLCTGDGGDGKIVTLFNFLGSLSGNPFTPVKIGQCGALNAEGVPNIVPTHLVLSEHNVSWRAGLDYRVSAGTLVYGNISRGYKAGSYPLLPGSQVDEYRPVTQESVTAYEAGIKTDLLDRHVHVNAAAFYYDYKNKQVLGRVILPIFGVSNALVNVPKSRIFGLESDVTIRPMRYLTLTGSATYLDTRVQRYIGYDAIGNFKDLSGNKLPFAPKFSYNIDAEYRYQLAAGGAPFAGVSVSGVSGLDTTISGSTLVIPAGPAVRILPGLIHPFTAKAFATVDLRLGYEAPGGTWRVMAYGKNVLNKYYWNNVTDQAEAIGRYAGYPATYGIMFGSKFK